MKKLVSLFVGLIMIGIFATTVAAEEYEVKKGDTLWDIANNHNIEVEELMNVNGLNSTLIHPKQILKLNGHKNKYYIVHKGDTLSGISKSYGDSVTVADLKAWNDLSSDLIITGEQIIVNGTETVQQEVNQLSADVSQAPVKADPVIKEKAGKEVTQSIKKKEAKQSNVEGRTLTVEATAYTANCAGCSGVTATGVNLNENENAKVIAVDPSVIPLGTKVYVEDYGYAVAADTGGAINGQKIDVHFSTKDEAYSWGRKTVDITILE
ncbi:cell wall-binding protein [Virgibacillus phasianinus]|uniref:Cell wall-binding protein n=1 Tax=Virgibacillus phasianinus TaxID=2017483 RepID=A0A220U5Z8_9BACI|nr:3D domain-containing protein [Virgibacillus phasianinus]ASK63402.1 cell wall-binding protein [Virgibacillus phasianinus]